MQVMIHPEQNGRDPNNNNIKKQTTKRWTLTANLIRLDTWCQLTKEMIRIESTMNRKFNGLCVAAFFGFITYSLIVTLLFGPGSDVMGFSRERIVSVSVFGTLAFLYAMNLCFPGCPSTTTSSVFGAVVASVTALSHLLHLLDFAPFMSTSFGQRISLIQFGEWIICVPVLVMSLGHILCLDHKFVCIGALLQVLCILFGLIASIVPSQAWAIFFLVLSSVAMLPIYGVIYISCFKLAHFISPTERRQIKLLGFSTIVLWSTFPIIYFCGTANIISTELEHTLMMRCDIMSKGFFLSLMTVFKFQITLRRQATTLGTLQKKEDAQRMFLRFVFHEVRVPFHAVLLGLEHLKEIEEWKEFTPLVETMLSAAKMMNRVINDVLSLSRLEDGRLNLRPEAFSLPKLVMATTKSFQEMCNSKKVEISTRLDEKIPPVLYGDHQRISQVLANLVSNAIKFSKPYHKVWITICIVDQNQGCCCFTIKVKDEGIGISKEDQSKLFKPYVQIKPHENQDGHGSGLGLSITKHLVELHGGSITLSSEIGKGSEFTVLLKLPVMSQWELQDPGSARGHFFSRRSSINSRKSLNSASSPNAHMPSNKKLGSARGHFFSRRSSVNSRKSWNSASSPNAHMPSNKKPWSGRDMFLARTPRTPRTPGRSVSKCTSYILPRESSVKSDQVASPNAEMSYSISKRWGKTFGKFDEIKVEEESMDHKAPVSQAQSPDIQLQALPRPSANPRNEISESYQRYLILVVDDSDSSRRMTSMILAKQGYIIEEACDGLEAVTKAKEKFYDLIIMDNIMPKMTGIEAARDISVLTTQVPIIGLTGSCLDEDVEEFRSAGACIVLAKPCGKADLLTAVRKALRPQISPFV